MAEDKKTTKELFSEDFIKEMEEVLVTKKRELEQKLGIDGSESEDTYPDYGDDEDDNIHEIEEFIVNENIREMAEKELRDVNKALERMKEGTYGICKYTSEKISEERLRARPTSSSSVQAKSSFKP